ncbi:MAG: aminotransferase class IV family protein [Gammaproteobacteria bacterium]
MQPTRDIFPDDPAAGAVLHDDRPATAADLAPLAFAGYAHFTAMQVRDGRVRGLDLHLQRLREASQAMFGRAIPDERVRSRMREALARSAPDASLTATVYSRTGEFSAADGGELGMLVRTGAAARPPAGPLALMAVTHQRALARYKHVGEVAKTWYLREAVARGFDDAAFVDPAGHVAEATIWNLAFWDGKEVVWPIADVLPGIAMGIARRQLRRLGVPQREQALALDDLAGLSAVVMNSWSPGVAVSRIGEVVLPPAPEFVRLLHEAHANEPLHSP